MTDKFIEGSDILPKVLKPLDAKGIEYVILAMWSQIRLARTSQTEVAALEEHGCDFIISLGGSPQDAASCISIIATNGGKPQDYEGLHKIC